MPSRGQPWKEGGLVDETVTSADIMPETITLEDLEPSLQATAGSGGHVIEDNGTPLTDRPTLNFVGAGVVASDDGEKTVVTIAGGNGQVEIKNFFQIFFQDAGPFVTTAPTTPEEEIAKWKFSGFPIITSGSKLQLSFLTGGLQCDLNDDSGGGGSAQIQVQESQDNGVTDSWGDFAWSGSGSAIPPAVVTIADREFLQQRTSGSGSELWIRLSINKAGSATEATFTNIFLDLWVNMPDGVTVEQVFPRKEEFTVDARIV